jgi:putative tributyrin esterase
MTLRASFPLLISWCALAQGNLRLITVPAPSLKGSRPAHVLLPQGYDASPARYPVLYLLHGHGGNYKNWIEKTNLAAYAAPYPLIIVMPDGENSWYTNSATRPDYRYEDFIVKDLISHIDGHFRSIADRHGRGIAGLSMGGFGALKIGLKFPNLFRSAASFSGALGLARTGLNLSGRPDVARSVGEAFGPDTHEAHGANDPFTLVPKLGPARPWIYFDCGNSDGLLESNRQFARLLAEHKIAYEYREPPGAHTWEYWDRQIREYLRLLAQEWRLPPAPVPPAGAPLPVVGPPPVPGPHPPR